ncbi:MAG: Polyprenol monophosphomannose synthase [Acidimicrobiaceae bacterium]|nr:Polyprenol monophosphomannose synthase [Acidimicrobiaceae bacterium]
MIGRWAKSQSARVLAAFTGAASLLAVVVLAVVVDTDELAAGLRVGVSDGAGLMIISMALLAAFMMRALAWCRTLPGLTLGQSLAAIHLALGGNHVLPFRLGEPLRIASVARRTDVGVAAATSTTVLLRAADTVSLATLGVIAAPRLITDELGGRGAALLTVVGLIGIASAMVVATQRSGPSSTSTRSTVRFPGPTTFGLVIGAWLAEAVVVWQVAKWFHVGLAPREAMAVLAAAVLVQAVALTPGGVGTYEAAGSAALIATGVVAPTAVALIIVLHAVKTLYSLIAGSVALLAPTPSMLGRLRLDRPGAVRPPSTVTGDDPVVLFLPAHNEAERIAAVIEASPDSVNGHPVEVVVIDDASTDDTAAVACAAGADVIAHARNRGLGAAVRTGLAHANQRGAAAAAFCDADGEYNPADLGDLVNPILRGKAHYVVGSRFAGDIKHMRPHRRVGNLALTRWVRYITRCQVSDGQSGYRALSAEALADAEIAHDYNYAQVLTIDVVAKGYGYHEVPISYEFRRSGRSFVRLGTYLRNVIPTVWCQLNRPTSRSQTNTKENPTCSPEPDLVSLSLSSR